MSGELKAIKIKSIKPNPYNPRKEIDPGGIAELAQSITELGLLQPPTVYPKGKSYVVLCGERRLAALGQLAREEVVCNVVRPPKDAAEAIQMALVENLQREDIRTSEAALAIVELRKAGLPLPEIADTLGACTEYVSTRYYIALHPEVLKAFIAAGETDIGIWALIGELETSGTRKNAIGYIKDGFYNSTRVKNIMRAVKKLEKLNAKGVESKLVTGWMAVYTNSKQKVTQCGERYGGETCKDCCTLSYEVLRILGWKDQALRDERVCLRKDETCFAYKKERQATLEEKLGKCTAANLIREVYGYFANGYEGVQMSAAFFGGKACAKCKSRYKIPDACRYMKQPGDRYSNRFKDPYIHCLAEDRACYKKKLAEFKKATTKKTTGPKGLSKRTDDQLKKRLYELVASGNGQYYEARNHIEILEKRGYKVTITYDCKIEQAEEQEGGKAA